MRLRRTELRHRILRACSVGLVRVATEADDAGDWHFKVRYSTYSQMSRAVNSLHAAGFVRIVSGEVVPTPAGDLELYAWNAHFGSVQAA